MSLEKQSIHPVYFEEQINWLEKTVVEASGRKWHIRDFKNVMDFDHIILEVTK